MNQRRPIQRMVKWMCLVLLGGGGLLAPGWAQKAPTPAGTDITVHSIHYTGRMDENSARFTVTLDLEKTGKGSREWVLLDGDLTILTARLPDAVRLDRRGSTYRLAIDREGRFKAEVDLVARVKRSEPWNEVALNGPDAVIGTVALQAEGKDLDVELLTGIVTEKRVQGAITEVKGLLGGDRSVVVRWQSRAVEIGRKAVLTSDVGAALQISPTVVRYVSVFKIDILQGVLPRLVVDLPAGHSLTQVQGEEIRDWQIRTEGGRQRLAIEFIKPIEKSYVFTLRTEQPILDPQAGVKIDLPHPQAVERETGRMTVRAEDVVLEAEVLTGLRQINAEAGAVAAYQFHAGDFDLKLKMRRIEPVIAAEDRVTVRVEEARVLVQHLMNLIIEKAGVYAVELIPPKGWVVAEVKGDDVAEWKMSQGTLIIHFANRVLGARTLELQLEQAVRPTGGAAGERPALAIAPVRVSGAVRESAQIGVAAANGIQLKPDAERLIGLRELPIGTLSRRSDETLAYQAEQPDWSLVLRADRLQPRVTAEVFNLITVGDGLLGGSATIRYAILNQGVQEFRVRVPALWKNVDFTGPNIRRKEWNGEVWVISLQDKVWGGYSLVVTYDYPFDPHQATLPVGGIHPEGVERETGSIAITSAGNLRLNAVTGGEAIRRVDETELAASDRALISRPVLLAYLYQGGNYGLSVEINRYEELPILDAAADHLQLTTVLTEDGQMLTQASFMVKNNDRQFQVFNLPEGADFWSCHVKGQPAKPERKGAQLLIPLPRDGRRDEAFAVEIVYAQKAEGIRRKWFQPVRLEAPKTDMQTTYAEWEVFVPPDCRMARFAGSMIVARGTTYGFYEAWREFVTFFDRNLFGFLPWLSALCGLGLCVILGFVMVRKGLRGCLVATGALVGMILVLVMVFMFLPIFKMGEVVSGDESAPADGRGAAATIVGDESINQYSRQAEVPREMDTSEVKVEIVESGEKEDEPLSAVRVLTKSPLIMKSPPTPPKPIFVSGSQVMAAGLKSLRIDIPRTGQRYVFTKVLNVRNEILTLQALAMKRRAHDGIRGGLQGLAFLLGLALVIGQARGEKRRSLPMALGWALMLGGLASCLIQYRLLGGTLALAAVAVGFAIPIGIVVVICRKILRTPRSPRAGAAAPGMPEEPPSPTLPPPLPPTLTLLLMAAFLAPSVWANPTPAAAPAPASILSAVYTGQVQIADPQANARIAQFEALFEIRTESDGQTVFLLGPEVALMGMEAPAGRGWGFRKTEPVTLVRDQGRIGVMIPRAGITPVRLKYLVKPRSDATSRRLEFGMPDALLATAVLTLDESEAAVTMPGALSLKTQPVPVKPGTAPQPGTRVEAILSNTNRLEVQWTPKMIRAADITATIFCQNAAVVTFDGGALHVASHLDYQILQGEMKTLHIRLPAGHRLMRVEGPTIRTWTMEQDVLRVELMKGVSPRYRLLVETEKSQGMVPAAVKIEVLHPIEITRETGLVGFKVQEELSLTFESQENVQKIDAPEFLKALEAGLPPADGPAPAGTIPPAPLAIGAAYRFLRPDFGLTVRAETVQPQIEAIVRNDFKVGFDQVTLNAQIRYTIKRAGTFTLRVGLPEGYRLDDIRGTNMAQWAVRNSGADASVEITLKTRAVGNYVLDLALVRFLNPLPATLNLTGVRPLEARKITGTVAVSVEEGLQIRSDRFDGLSEIPVSALGGVAGLGFKILPADGGEGLPMPWSLTLTTESLQAWVRAEVATAATLTENLVNGRSQIRYEIVNAPTRQFRFRVPPGYRNVDVTGLNIRRKEFDEKSREWIVELHNKVRGTYALTVTWDLPWAIQEGGMDFEGLEVLGVERETGILALSAPARLSLAPRTMPADLLKADKSDLPAWAPPSAEPPVLVARYLRPGYKWGLKVEQFEDAEVLQALAENVRLTTVVAEDGQLMTEMALSVRNNARQYLEMELPESAEVWSAFVGGQPVRPSRKNGKVLIPMERSGVEVPVEVELTFVGATSFPVRKGKVHLVSPALDIPYQNAQWELLLPADYRFSGFDGSMKKGAPPAVAMRNRAPVSATYSYAAYALDEQVQSERKREIYKADLGSAKDNLEGGKLKEANEMLRRVKRSSGRRDGDLDRLEGEFRKAQARNMIQAQQQFVEEIDEEQGARQGGGAALNAPGPGSGQVQAELAQNAEYQWDKVQAAQEVVETKNLPLRINLPRRGVQLRFSQVLQTEIGQPMTIDFTAANQRALSWPKAAGWGGLGFAALWGLVALIGRWVDSRRAAR